MMDRRLEKIGATRLRFDFKSLEPWETEFRIWMFCVWQAFSGAMQQTILPRSMDEFNGA